MYLTFDLEPFWATIPQRHTRSDWNLLDDASGLWAEKIFEFCVERNFDCTFFIVAQWAVRNKEIVRRISDAGFPIGSHSNWHEDCAMMDNTSFREDCYTSRAILEEICGQDVVRYRAPSFSIRADQFSILEECGFEIDSSITKASRIYGGMREPSFVPSAIQEYPMKGSAVFGSEITLLGGGYLRLLPPLCLKYLLNYDIGNMIYLHPHDFPPDVPSYGFLSTGSNLRRRLRFGSMFDKLDLIAQRHDFSSI